MNTYSLLLLLGAVNGAVLAALLWYARANRLANRLLAGLIALVSLRLVPYVIGYAGAYDAHPWLTFLPLDLSLAFGPLLWAYVVALTTGELPSRRRLHALPAALQLAYGLVCFALPLDAKWDWYTGPHLRGVAHVESAAALVSMGAYLALSWRRYRAYRHWLVGNVSNAHDAAARWLGMLLAGMGATVAVGAAFAAAAAVVPLDYFDRFPLMLWLAGLVYFLGLMGWRYGDRAHPAPAPEPAPAQAEPAELPPPPAAAPRWAERVEAAGWWRDDTLTLAKLAAHLGTSTRTLSRVLNEEIGESFSEFINRMRVRAVAAELRDPASTRDLLVIALDAGFSSKASFNRAFKAYTGVTPSEFRKSAPREGLNTRQSGGVAAIATHGERP